MFPLSANTNLRFDGYVHVTIHGKQYTIEASEFELAEADTRHIGDGDQLYSELWIASPQPQSDSGSGTDFDSIHVSITRLNAGPYEFAGRAEVIGASTRLIEVDDELELFAWDDQGPGVDPY